jgi:excisionase family DNA binding protein
VEVAFHGPAASAPDFLSVREAAKVLRIGKTCAYELAQQYLHTDGAVGLKVLRVGRQLRVPRTALEEMLGGPISWPPCDAADPVESPEVDATRPPAPKSARRKSPEQSPRLFAL